MAKGKLNRMPRRLIIAEKPSVARDIAYALGVRGKGEGFFYSKDLYVTWAMGHLFEIDEGIAPRKWSMDTLPIFPEFKYRPRRAVVRQVQVISKLLREAEEVVNCGDAGREGELIVREILRELGYSGKVFRLWTSEALTPEVVRKVMRNLKPSQEFDSLYFGALARQHSDWLVGINLSRAVTLRAGGNEVWSVGRVQTPTLRMVVERDREVDNFRPEEYWVVLAKFRYGEVEYLGVLVRDGKEVHMKREEAEEIVSRLRGFEKGKVGTVSVEEVREMPPLLHSLTSLQREANAVLGTSAKTTLDVAQRLYEQWKVISYPRTDARHLGEDRNLAVTVLKRLDKEDLVPRVYRVGKRVFDPSKLTDHHAIIPLDKPPSGLSKIERSIYDLIWRKFIGAFMEDYVYRSISLVTLVGGESFLSRGKRVVQEGWHSLYPMEKVKDLPDLREGEETDVMGVGAERRETKPPPRFTDGTLLKEMEKFSLGTPATRAQIIESLIKRRYLRRSRKSLISTDKGRELVEKMSWSSIVSPEMTSKWELSLESIYRERKGEEGYREFVERIKEFVREELEKVKNVEFVQPVREPLRCSCGGEVEVKGKKWTCKSCGKSLYTWIGGKYLTEKQASEIMAGKEVLVRGLRSKKGTRYDAYLSLKDGKLNFRFPERRSRKT